MTYAILEKRLTRAFQRCMTHDNQTYLRLLKIQLCEKLRLVFCLFLKNGKRNGNVMYTILVESYCIELFRY